LTLCETHQGLGDEADDGFRNSTHRPPIDFALQVLAAGLHSIARLVRCKAADEEAPGTHSLASVPWWAWPAAAWVTMAVGLVTGIGACIGRRVLVATVFFQPCTTLTSLFASGSGFGTLLLAVAVTVI